jgi:tetratricopeptide (TPR) repeat protein
MKRRFEKLRVPIAMLVIGLSTGLVHAELVGHWKFDEGAGTVAHDSSIYGNDGTLEGDPHWVSGRFGGALELNGAGDWLDCGTHPSLEISDAVSITAWIKVGIQRVDHKLGGNQDDANGGYKMAVFSNNKIEFEIRTSDNMDILNRDVAGGTEIEVGVWYHVAGVYSLEDGYIRTYVNGVLDRELLTTQVLGASPGSFKIGCEPFATSSYNFNGVIDDLRIYNHAIDEDDIKQLYDRGGASLIPTGYVAKLAEETENIVKELEPEEAVVFIEKKIADYERWRTKNLSHVKSRDKRMSSDIYVLLARAKEAAGAPIRDVIATYKQSVSQPQKPSNYIPVALLWLFEKTPTEEYINVVRECVRNSDDPSRNIYDVAKYFEPSGSWTAFELFLNAMFSEVNDTTSYARLVANGLEDDGVWADKFLEYCRNKPELTEYLFRKHEKIAGKYIAKKNFKKAAEIYRDIIKQCGPHQQKSIYEFKLYECLFNSGQYDSVIHGLDSFIKNNKNTHKLLISKAIILKGQAYVQLGDIDRATDAFFTLTVEYPEVKEAPEANFFVGYCYMLQDEFDEATEAFNIVVKDYPESSYANKASLSLIRIKDMSE